MAEYQSLQGYINALEKSGGTPYINKFGQRVVPYKPYIAPPAPTDAMGFTQAGRDNMIKRDDRGNPIQRPSQIVKTEPVYTGPKTYDEKVSANYKSLKQLNEKQSAFINAAKTKYKAPDYSKWGDPNSQFVKMLQKNYYNNQMLEAQKAWQQTAEGQEYQRAKSEAYAQYMNKLLLNYQPRS